MKQTSKQKWFNTHVLFERPAVLLEIPSPTAKTKTQIEPATFQFHMQFKGIKLLLFLLKSSENHRFSGGIEVK